MAPSTLIRFQTKTELFCSVFKTICVHTYRFRITFARPHYNAVSVLKTLLYPQCACSNEFDACAFQYTGPQNRPFPSSLVPLFQNESKCETFHMKMSSACSFIPMQIKVIFIRMVFFLIKDLGLINQHQYTP